MATERVLINVWEMLVDAIDRRMEQACLKRDAFLDHVLRHEAQQLRFEIPEANSDRAYTYICQELNQLRRKPMNLQLSGETVSLINDVCTRNNIPIDAFIHRVLFLLLAGQKTIEKLIPDDWNWAREKLIECDSEYLYESFKNSTLLVISETVKSDPFWYPRRCLEILRDQDPDTPTLYSAVFGKYSLMPTITNAIGFNCYFPDRMVDETFDNIETRKQVDEFLSALQG